MEIPALVQSTLGDEEVAAHVPLSGEDALFVTGTRTLVYTADGLLSDENVTEHPHGAERVAVSEGRRKAKVTLDYGLDGEETLSVPSNSLDDVLHPLLAGVLNAADVTQPGETVKRTYRFSELTLVVTSDRLVKHVGAAVWDTDHEEIPFETVTGIDAEEGSVSSQLVLETTERTERIKAPNEQFRDVRETVEEALYAHHGASSAAEFEELNVEDGEQAAASGASEVSFGGGVDPIDTSGLDEDDDAAAPEASAADASASTQSDADGGRATAGDQTGAAGGERVEADERPTDGQRAATGDRSPDEAADDGDDEFEASGFETAAATVEPPVDPEELESEIEEMAVVVEEMADALDRQREVIDAQREILDAQRERLDRLQALASED